MATKKKAGKTKKAATKPVKKSSANKKAAKPLKKPVAKKATAKKSTTPAKKSAAPAKKKMVTATKAKQKPAAVKKLPKAAGTKSVSARNTPKVAMPAAAKPAKADKPTSQPLKHAVMPVSKVNTTKTMTTQKNSNGNEKTRYSDSELKEFKELIMGKLSDARNELVNLNAAIISANENGTDDTGASFKMLEDGSDTLAKEEAAQLAARQKKFIEQLEAALVRIENKTYGVCRVTGKLIPKERLRAVPHTTQSMEAKLQQYRE
jgi:DnaK suppressor protein